MQPNQQDYQHWVIKDLKGVGDVELKLDDSKRVFVFLGSNGVGKTKTLEALFLFLLATVQNFNTKESFKVESRLASCIAFNGQQLEFNGSEHPAFSDINIFENIFSKIVFKTFDAIAYLGAQHRSSSDKIAYRDSQSIGSFEVRRAHNIKQITEAIVQDKLSELGMNEDIHHWFVERAQSVNPYQKREDNRKVDIDTVLNALNQLDSRIDKTLNVDGDNNVYLSIEGKEFELTDLSSGFISIVKIIQSIISAYAAFTNTHDLLNVYGVVLIDEIESHLHVDWQTRIIPTLKVLFPNTTFYIATHSPLVLSQLEEGEAYLLKREDDNVVRSQVIDSPNKRILANVLQDAFGIDLNALKRDAMIDSDQSLAKDRLLTLLDDSDTVEGDADNG